MLPWKDCKEWGDDQWMDLETIDRKLAGKLSLLRSAPFMPNSDTLLGRAACEGLKLSDIFVSYGGT